MAAHTAGPGLAGLIENEHRGRAELVERGISVAERAGNQRRSHDPGRSHGCGLDIHLHDPGELGAFEVDLIVERTRALGPAGRGARRAAHLDRHRRARRRPAPPLGRLRAAGVEAALGSDGIRDLGSPWGNGDLLERASLPAYRSGFRRDEDLAAALELATFAAARSSHRLSSSDPLTMDNP